MSDPLKETGKIENKHPLENRIKDLEYQVKILYSISAIILVIFVIILFILLTLMFVTNVPIR